jgi:hypothetical protein
MSPLKCPLFLSDFNQILILETDIEKNTQISNFLKIRPAEAELFYVDRWTDRDGQTETDRQRRTDREMDREKKRHMKKLIVAFTILRTLLRRYVFLLGHINEDYKHLKIKCTGKYLDIKPQSLDSS